jgi:ribosomal protein S18 acetylase RimI-like enzyme
LIRFTTPNDTAAIIALAESSGLFNPDGIEQIRERLANHASGNSDDLWFIADDDKPSGVVYCAPEPMTDRTWNVLMLLVSPDRHGQGVGAELMRHVEETLTARGGRLLIVETSSLDGFERARAFYTKCGYNEEARIRDFYTAGDDKVVYSKPLGTRVV